MPGCSSLDAIRPSRLDLHCNMRDNSRPAGETRHPRRLRRPEQAASRTAGIAAQPLQS